MAGHAPIRLTSPRGRLVQGDAFEPQTTDAQGIPLTIKTGPNAGQPTKRWFIAVAYSKTDPATMPYLMSMAQYAATAWPAYFPSGATQAPPLFGCVRQNFSMKVMDGDGVDDNGKQNRDKAGFAGHWVVKYSTSIQAPGVWQEPNFDEMARINDPRMLPKGYFVKVNHTIQSNQNDQRPGIYVNLDKIAICADQAGAEVIQSGPTAAEAFGAGGSTPATPPLPVTPPAAPDAHTPPASPPVPTSVTPSPSSPPPTPYAGFIPETGGKVMLPAANGATYEHMIAAGWTDAMLVQHGMMQA